ncbi:MAG: NADH-quinone oxidoreductase subunit [Actinomycetota bacterium]|jgi:NADH-quinone oxidoreductase subunit C|nr:NADH-quinone oxidoreductase subunit [Actinomycetota bacterium]
MSPDAPAETAEDEAEAEPAPPPTLHGAPLSESRGQTVVHPDRTRYLDLIRTLKDEGFVSCVDLCGVDYLLKSDRPLPDGVVPERFEVAVNLLSLAERRRIRVRVQLPEDDPRLPSLYELHPGTEAMERETYDMFGILFDGHPDLSRILMPDDWEGHPLRKDYGIGRIPVQFKAPGGSR